MNGSFFLDTNIFVYTFDDTAPAKRETAKQLVRQALVTQKGVVSFQIVQEFLNVATRKFTPPLPAQEAERYLREVFSPLYKVASSLALYEHSLFIAQRWRYSFYDSLVITAALEANCTTLYSEDLQAGQKVETLSIVNPFVS